jgi:autotransporter-associated beta strand protein
MKPIHQLIFATTLLATANVTAANLTWNTTTGDWDLSALNWNPGPIAWTQTSATVATNAAIFAGSDGAVGAYTVTAGEALAAQTLTFNNTGYKLYSTGASKTITVTNAGNSGSVNFSVATGKTASVGSSGGAVQTIIEQAASNLHISGGGTLRLDNGAYVRGGTSGAGILLGNITVDLATGANLRALSASAGNFLLGYTAGTTSVLNINGGTALQSYNGANGLIVGNLGNGTLNISATAGSQMLVSSPNMLLASGAASSGTVNLDGGLLSVRAITKGSGTATFNFNGGTLRKSSTSAADLLNFTSVVKSGGALIDTNGVDATISGNLTDGGGNGGLSKLSTGNLTLSGANTYTGNTTVNAGNLILNNPSDVSISGNLVHNTTSGSLVKLGASEQIADTGLFTFMPTAAGRLQLQGFNETITGLEGSGANTRIVEAAQDNQASSPATLTLDVTGANAYIYDGFVRDAAGVSTSKLTLIKDGTGTQTFSGSSSQVSYSGPTTINNGVLEFSGTSSAANNSAITVNSPGSIKFSAAATRSASISGSGNLIAAATGGTVTLSGAGHTYTGDTTVSAGALSINSAFLADAADVRLATGTTLDLNFVGTDAIDELFINNVKQANGTWGSLSSSALNKTSQITGSGLLQVGPVGGYSSWASSFTSPPLSNTASTADPDFDGLTNAMEYALGLDPRFSSPAPGVSSNGGKTISFTKGAQAKTDNKVTYQIETSTTLGVTPSPWTVATTPVVMETTDTISITFPAGPEKNFARLKVALAP